MSVQVNHSHASLDQRSAWISECKGTQIPTHSYIFQSEIVVACLPAFLTRKPTVVKVEGKDERTQWSRTAT